MAKPPKTMHAPRAESSAPALGRNPAAMTRLNTPVSVSTDRPRRRSSTAGIYANRRPGVRFRREGSLWRHGSDTATASIRHLGGGDLSRSMSSSRKDPYLCRGLASSAGSGLSGLELRVGGGACARLPVWIVCARAPSLTSVRDPRVGSGAGDMMCDGVIPLGEALRPLGLSRPSTGWWRRDPVGSRPRRIGVSEGCARTGKVRRA
jgi:hypothetical protein